MLQYCYGHTRPHITFEVRQCSRYIHRHTSMNISALKRIGKYLLHSSEKGIILQPTPETSINCYADFAGLWNQEDHNDENCVKCRTGYVICMSDCTALCITHLQEGTALITMEAEYGALSMAMHDLLLFK